MILNIKKIKFGAKITLAEGLKSWLSPLAISRKKFVHPNVSNLEL
jgi:hypothetical protein